MENIEHITATLKDQEGCIGHMYLDTRGNVTVGVGQLLATPAAAIALGFVHRASGETAADDEITREFNSVKQQATGHPAGFYKQFTSLDLPPPAVDELLMQRIGEFESGLRSSFQGFDDYPADAKEALLDMAFNLGLSKLKNGFPKLVNAAQHHDWQSCATECHRHGIAERRNELTKTLFNKAGSQT